MHYDASSPEDYIGQIPKERQDTLKKLRQVINNNLPDGFEEGMIYKMIGYYVPHSVYAEGYHCDPKTPLPFMSFASQKNSVNLYHSGIYAKKELYDWFVGEFPKHSSRKLDMGKSCVRFKHLDDIPFELIGELTRKMICEEWIEIYESAIKKV
ncbi:DUF1801 domain-containing protein [Hyunsoonleella rubra]|uniref:DUF1801 domain-containing protein n=1 Tax=Hyunsoonleella rubra TaxID=1737062 RepID=A0ABW5TA64_9FLAO